MSRRAACLLVFAGVGCGGSPNGAPIAVADDAATDAAPVAVNDAAAPDDASAPDGAPAATSSTTFCADLEAHGVRCNAPAQCIADLAATCSTTFAPGFGAAFMTAFHECRDEVSCKGLDPGEDPCMFPKVVAQPPTAAQATLARDFCAGCAKGATTTTVNGVSCAGEETTLAQGYGRVLGVEVLSLGDTSAQQAENCIAPSVAAYPNDYLNCENLFLNCLAGLTPPPASCQ